jgi:ubiquinone/menaquinone biosynthesis C-methylase UbiE
MKAYSGLARVYDYLLSGVNYEEWADYLEKLFINFNVEPRRRIIDLACGTGNSTLPWAQRGYNVCGVDISAEMLAVARDKAGGRSLRVCFVQQDLRHLRLPEQGDVAVLYQDGLNYLLSTKELRQACRSICECVRPGGFFIFNVNMVDMLPTGQSPQVSFLDEPEMTLLWESAYTSEERIWRIHLIAFLRENGALYSKIEEEHRERSHSREELETIFTQTGWRLRACLKAFTLEEPTTQERNIFYVIQREGI